MQASKVTISQETRAKLDNPILTPKRRRELRQRLIVDAIRGNKKLMSKQQLIAVAGLNPNSKTMDYANGMTLIKSMVKRGIISHNETPSYYKKWSVVGDAPRKYTKRQPVVTPTPESVAESVMPKQVMVALQDYETVDKMNLIDMAKEFSWRENSDSLREFIAYIENAIK